MSFYDTFKKFMAYLMGPNDMDIIKKTTRYVPLAEAKKDGPIIEKIMDYDPTALENIGKQYNFIIDTAFIFTVMSDKLELLKKYDKSLVRGGAKLCMNILVKNSADAEMKTYVRENFRLSDIENVIVSYSNNCELYESIIRNANGDDKAVTPYTLAKYLYHPEYVNELYEFCCFNGHFNIIKRIEGRYDVMNDNYRGLMIAFENNHRDIIIYLVNTHAILEYLQK